MRQSSSSCDNLWNSSRRLKKFETQGILLYRCREGEAPCCHWESSVSGRISGNYTLHSFLNYHHQNCFHTYLHIFRSIPFLASLISTFKIYSRYTYTFYVYDMSVSLFYRQFCKSDDIVNFVTRTMLEPLSFLLNLITRSIKIKEFFRNKIKFLLFPFDLLKSEFSWLCFERIRTVFNRHCSKSVDYSNSTRKKLVLKRVFLNKGCHQITLRQLM